MGWSGVAAVLALATLFAQTIQAELLYSVDITNDELVLLDSVTGGVTVIGPLNDNAHDIDLALTSDGRLWGLNSGLGNRVDIWEIDTATGAIISSFQVFDGAVAVQAAEGLAARSDQLKIAFDPLTTTNSTTLADLSATGVTSGTLGSSLDMDGLAGGHSNPFGLYAMDRNSGVDTRLYGIDPVTNLSTLIGVYSDLGLHDLVTLPGEVIAIDTFTGELYRIDILTGAVVGAPVTLLLDLNYNGLALAPTATWDRVFAIQADGGDLHPSLLLGLSDGLAQVAGISPCSLEFSYSGLSPNAEIQLNLASFGIDFYPPDEVRVIGNTIEVDIDDGVTMFTLEIAFSSTSGENLNPATIVAFNPQPEPPAASLYRFDPPPASPADSVAIFIPLSGGAGAPGETQISLQLQVLDDFAVALPLSLVSPVTLPALGGWAQAALGCLLAGALLWARRRPAT
jgi:hypothetical protein